MDKWADTEAQQGKAEKKKKDSSCRNHDGVCHYY